MKALEELAGWPAATRLQPSRGLRAWWHLVKAPKSWLWARPGLPLVGHSQAEAQGLLMCLERSYDILSLSVVGTAASTCSLF